MNDYKIIIDAAHGGQDYGETLKNFEEKDYCLYLSKQLVIALKKENLNVQTTREKDINLEPSKRIEKIRKMITNSNKTIILSIHSHFDNEFTNIIDSKNDTTNLANIIYKNLKKENIKVIEPTIKILPANWDQDYYYIQREININPTIILNCFFDTTNPNMLCSCLINQIVSSILEYINESDLRYSYTVKKGDSLYLISKQTNTSVDNIKKENNLVSNTLQIGQILEIPEASTSTKRYFSYTVKSGDNLYQIARKYGTTLQEIKNLNNLVSNLLSVGQTLKIPITIEEDTTITIPEYEIYTVKKGDSLYTIAKKFNTTVNEIMKTNSLGSTTLSINQQLKIKTKSSNLTTVLECIGDPNLYEVKEETTTYIVKKGDSLYLIAKRFNTTVNEIIKLNNLKSTSLSINQELKIPNTSSSTGLENISYTVKKGDSLYSIAKQFNTTVNKIKDKNNLTTNSLNIGQILIIERET